MAQEVVEQVSRKNAYPNYWEITDKIQDIISKYKDIENGERITETNISLIGRVLQKRESSKKLVFYTIVIDGIDFQIISDLNSYSNEEDFYKIQQDTKLGDILGIRGYIGKGKRGELSIFPRMISILAPCLHDLPSTYYGVEDKELRYSNRYLDLIINKDVRNIFVKRYKIIKFLRDYLDEKEFMEVETPVLSNSAGGATANKGGKVSIIISKGPRYTFIPKTIITMEAGAGKATLESLGLKVKVVTIGNAKKKVVKKVSPAVNTKVLRGSLVTITVG